MMTTRMICERLTRMGFGITIIYHADNSVSACAVGTRTDARRVTAPTELQAAVLLWNRLGCLPQLGCANGKRVAEVVPVPAPSWPRRLLHAGLRLVRGPAAKSDAALGGELHAG